jgi:hypothetical protein
MIDPGENVCGTDWAEREGVPLAIRRAMVHRRTGID